MFQAEDDDEIKQPPQSSDAMSLSEKMNLWGKMSGEKSQPVDKADLFQGIEEYEDEGENDIISSNMPEYTKTILSSKAYDWLVASLLKQTSFHWDESHPRTMIDGIQQPILASLPKRKISRRTNIDDYNVAFWLPWLPIKQRISQEKNELRSSHIRHFIALTGSSTDQIVATTVKQYFKDTWVSSGAGLLDAIQREVDRVERGIAKSEY